MINYRKMSKSQAKEFVDGIDNMPEAAFLDLTVKWGNYSVEDYDVGYEDLRHKVVEVFKENHPQKYMTDLNVGLALYEELNETSGFTTVMANDDDIWRYLSCKVFPDITYLRYPAAAQGDIHLNKKRFYSHTRRIWVKTLWWYIHLSWQGDIDNTYDVLKDMGTDTISDFIERTGRGYRLKLYRDLIKEYSEVENKTANLFNQIQVQNLVNCRTIEPALTENGEEGYVKALITQVKVEKEA